MPRSTTTTKNRHNNKFDKHVDMIEQGISSWKEDVNKLQDYWQQFVFFYLYWKQS